MATVSIDIPTAHIPRVAAVVQQYGPQLVPTAVPAGKAPNTWTQAESLAVLKAMLANFVKDLVKQAEVETAANAARQAAIASVDTGGLVS
jgi:hypothetical protein